MATIVKRGRKWLARVRVAGADEARSFLTKGEAQAWAAARETELRRRRDGGGAPGGVTFGDLLERYLDEVTPTKRGARWEEIRIKRMLGLGKDGRDPLCDIEVRRLVPEHVAQWRDRRLAKVSAASVLRELATLSAVCSWAVRELRWLDKNPCADIRKPERPPPRTRRVSDEEIGSICYVAGYVTGQPPVTATARVALAVVWAVETAMRAGEICGLTWVNVDLERRIAHLDRTKNGHPRDVPLSKLAVQVLEELRPVTGDGESVFGLTTAQLDAIFRKLKKRAMIEDLHFHDTRAEALTRLSKKLDVMQLARVSGHLDVKLLYNTYYRETVDALVEKLD